MTKKAKFRGWSIAIGAGIGTAIGISSDQLAVWIVAGVVSGMLFVQYVGGRGQSDD